MHIECKYAHRSEEGIRSPEAGAAGVTVVRNHPLWVLRAELILCQSGQYTGPTSGPFLQPLL